MSLIVRSSQERWLAREPFSRKLLASVACYFADDFGTDSHCCLGPLSAVHCLTWCVLSNVDIIYWLTSEQVGG